MCSELMQKQRLRHLRWHEISTMFFASIQAMLTGSLLSFSTAESRQCRLEALLRALLECGMFALTVRNASTFKLLGIFTHGICITLMEQQWKLELSESVLHAKGDMPSMPSLGYALAFIIKVFKRQVGCKQVHFIFCKHTSPVPCSEK